MLFLIIISVLLALGSAALLSLFLKERLSSAALRKRVSEELAYISNVLGRFSVGELGVSMKNKKKDLPPEIQGVVDKMKANFNKVTEEPLHRVCFVGADAWLEGIEAARSLGDRLRDGGRVAVVVTSSLEAPIMAQRHRSFCTTVANEFGRIEIAETFEAHADWQACTDYVSLNAEKFDGIYITGNSAVPAVLRGIAASGKKNIEVVCHDLDPSIVEGMQAGAVSASVVCSPFLQGHDAVVHLFNHIAEGWEPFQPRLMQSLRVVTKDNLSEFWDGIAGQPKLDAKFSPEEIIPFGDEEAEHPARRILVFTEDWNPMFKQLMIGIHAGASEIRAFNCEVEVKVLNQQKNPERQVLLEAQQTIESEIEEEGLDGIASFVGSAGMVSLLNKYSAQGIPVASFNSEPQSLRSMIDWLMISATRLSSFTEKYREGLDNVGKTQGSIMLSLESVAGRSHEQNASIKAGAESVSRMASCIEDTANTSEVQTRTVTQTSEISRKLTEIARFLNSQIAGMRRMGEQVKKSAEKTNAIKDFSEKIGAILSLIDSIAEQTNLLAFNAAVESSHAGEFGSGFKIISQEIRELADQSVKSTSSITELIDAMHAAVDEGIASNKTTLAAVMEQVSVFSGAAEQLDGLSKSLMDAVSQIHDVVGQNISAYGLMRDSASGINRIMTGSYAITDENNATIQKINEEFASMNSKFSDMAGRLSELSELISIMRGSVASFTA